MKNHIKYPDWPTSVKMITSLSNKIILIKNPSFALVIGVIVLFGGVIDLIQNVFKFESTNPINLLVSLSYIFIGLGSIANGYSNKWIVENSSWEERFDHQSSFLHKCLYIILTIFLLSCLYLVIKY